LRDRGWTIGLAESCTGGMVTASLTTVPQASDAVCGGVVAYSDETKQALLKVKRATLRDHGAVSAPVAREMAVAAKRIMRSDLGLAVTGVDAASIEGKPPGLSYIALCMPDDRVLIRRYQRDHGPGRNRERDVRMALRFIVDGVGSES
jgi:PncC family amidohydrolase